MFSLLAGTLPYFIVPFILALVFVPISKWFGFKLDIVALENKRTVHQGKIVRMGGLAIFLAFIISMAIYVPADQTWNGIVIGGTIVFFVGLIDDCLNIRPVYKLLGQSVAAMVAIGVGGITLGELTLPYGIVIDISALSALIAFVWIVGVTNAINLLDGLDGLASGIALIVLCTIGFIGFLQGRRDICVVTLILAGANLGFLKYNFHPASVFMGDCGALFLGFVIACLSLLGFKTTAFISLGLPVMILFVPISDTILAIIRRKLSGKSFAEADRNHLHHQLMYKLQFGHKWTVITLYIVTIAFSLVSILNFYNSEWGIWILILLLFIAEIFIEVTDMINPKFHPLMGLSRRIFGYPKKRNKQEDSD